MRLKPAKCAILLVLCWTLLGSIPLTAQEEKSDGGEAEAIAKEVQKEAQRSDPDPVLNSESELKNKPSTPVSAAKEIHRDTTLQTKPIKPVKTVEKTQKEEDPLSFNFLYYIIEKFKLSDIIE